MNQLGDLLHNEWDKIPQNFRYLFLVGALLIVNAWLLDHWGHERYSHFLFIDIAASSYFVGLFLIILGAVFLIAKQIVGFSGLLFLRRRYSPSKLNKTFYLISFKGKWILFDKNKKECFHIRPWETVLDLQFEGLATGISLAFQQGVNTQVVIKKGIKVDIDKYNFKGIIDTRG